MNERSKSSRQAGPRPAFAASNVPTARRRSFVCAARSRSSAAWRPAARDGSGSSSTRPATSRRSARSRGTRRCSRCGPGCRPSTCPAGRSRPTRTWPGRPTPTRACTRSTAVPQSSGGSTTRLLRADQIQWADGDDGEIDWLVPIVADAEAGFGGVLNAFELMKSMIAAGAAGVHLEDQLASEKKCGHLGGKVLVPTSQHIDAERRAAGRRRLRRADRSHRAHRRARRHAAHQRHRQRDRAVRHRRAHRRGLLPSCATASRPRSPAAWPTRPTRTCCGGDLHARPGRGRAISPRRSTRATRTSCSPTTARRRSTGSGTSTTPRSRSSRMSSAAHGLPLPVHHARRLPRAQRLDVRAGAAATSPRACRPTSALQEREFAAEARLHGDPPPARGRRRLLRPGRRRRWPAERPRRLRSSVPPSTPSSRRGELRPGREATRAARALLLRPQRTSS